MSNAFSLLRSYLYLLFVMWSIISIALQMLNESCILGINFTQSWCMILLGYCCVQFTDILLRILYLCTSLILACNYLLCVCVVYVWFGYQGNGFWKWVRKYSLLFNCFVQVWREWVFNPLWMFGKIHQWSCQVMYFFFEGYWSPFQFSF